jgi:corrinoid protein of di/trimethylamine methyltransferase
MAELYNAILTGNHKAAADFTRQALESGADALALVNQEMVPAMDEVGRRYECEEYFVPQLMLSARAMKSSLELLRPLLIAGNAQPAGRVAIGTVKGDLHDIGKNIVAAMLEGGGFEVIDLGTDVPPEKFVETVRARQVNLVCLSTLLTVTMPAMRSTVETLKTSDVRDRVKIMVGGAPVTERFAEQIGADGYTDNAAAAVAMARRLTAVCA